LSSNSGYFNIRNKLKLVEVYTQQEIKYHQKFRNNSFYDICFKCCFLTCKLNVKHGFSIELITQQIPVYPV